MAALKWVYTVRGFCHLELGCNKEVTALLHSDHGDHYYCTCAPTHAHSYIVPWTRSPEECDQGRCVHTWLVNNVVMFTTNESN